MANASEIMEKLKDTLGARIIIENYYKSLQNLLEITHIVATTHDINPIDVVTFINELTLETLALNKRAMVLMHAFKDYSDEQTKVVQDKVAQLSAKGVHKLVETLYTQTVDNAEEYLDNLLKEAAN